MQKYQVFNHIITNRLIQNMCDNVDNSIFYNGWQTRVATMPEMKSFRNDLHDTNQLIDIEISSYYTVFDSFMESMNHTYQRTLDKDEFLFEIVNDVDYQINPTYPELGSVFSELINQLIDADLTKADCYINLFGASLFALYHMA